MSIKRLGLAAIAALFLVKHLNARGSSLSGLFEALRKQIKGSKVRADGDSVDVYGRAVDARRLVLDVASMLGHSTGHQSSFHHDTELLVLGLALRFEGKAPQSIEALLERLNPGTFLSSHGSEETLGLTISDIRAVYVLVKSFMIVSRDAEGEFRSRLQRQALSIPMPGFLVTDS